VVDHNDLIYALSSIQATPDVFTMALAFCGVMVAVDY
jgi:hypothetical protein